MPSPERGPGGPSEQPRRQEAEPASYLRAARFPNEQTAGIAYGAVQDAIFAGAPNDLSAYRFQLNRIYHVAVLGQPPPPDLDQQLEDLLAGGEPATLPRGVLLALAERRRQMSRYGPWSEGHYRPSRPL